MHCAACEVLVERAFKHDPSVARVKAYQSGYVEVWGQDEPNLIAANERLAPHGYRVQVGLGANKFSLRRLGGIALIIVATYVLFRKFSLVPNISTGEDLSLGVVFVMGLVAAVSSCIAVTGGLLVALSTAHAQAHPEATGWQKFRPHVFFNIGRVFSYGILGGAVGLLGSALALSPVWSGTITLLASLAMVFLGFRLLNLFPSLARVTLRPPKFIAHRLHDAAGNPRPWAPFLLGAGTFFLPCGFTQALQLYVLTRGDAAAGALTMLVFSLGTLPALVGLGAVTSFLKGRWQQAVAMVAGAAVVALGFMNLGFGLTLTGLSAKAATVRENFKITLSRQGVEVADPNVRLENGVQVVAMDVVARGYSPNRFTVRAGVPVRWEIQGVNTYGCQSVLQFPALNLTKYIKPGLNVVEFTPQGAGQLPFHCAMGMYTGSFTVLPAEGEARAAPVTVSVVGP